MLGMRETSQQLNDCDLGQWKAGVERPAKAKSMIRNLSLQHLNSRSVMLNPRPACDPVEGFMRPSLGFRYNISGLHTDNLSFFSKS